MQVEQNCPKIRRRDPGSMLLSQIKVLAGNSASVSMERERPWASITFSGTRHRYMIDGSKIADLVTVQNLAKTLPDHEFTIPGHFVADILVTELSSGCLLVEALSIIDPIEYSDADTGG